MRCASDISELTSLGREVLVLPPFLKWYLTATATKLCRSDRDSEVEFLFELTILATRFRPILPCAKDKSQRFLTLSSEA